MKDSRLRALGDALPPELPNHPEYEIRRELGEAAWAWCTWPTTA